MYQEKIIYLSSKQALKINEKVKIAFFVFMGLLGFLPLWLWLEGGNVFNLLHSFYFFSFPIGGLILRNKKFNYSNRVIIGDNHIKVKMSPYKKATIYSLEEVKEIKLGSYLFYLIYESGETQKIVYESSSEESKEIKGALRKIAEKQDILIHY